MFDNDFLTIFPEIFLINATILLLIYGVILSTSKTYDYPPLVRNVGWLGLPSVSMELCGLVLALYPTPTISKKQKYLVSISFTLFNLTKNSRF